MSTAPGGRPRDPDVDRRVLVAALEVYGQHGWARTSIEAVARVAGVGKASIYLRWPTKDDLLADALGGIAHLEDVKGSDLRSDLVEMVTQLLHIYIGPSGPAAMRIPVEAQQVPAVHALWEQSKNSQTQVARTLVRRAIRRGELPRRVPINLLLEMLFGAAAMHVQLTPFEGRADLFDVAPSYAEQLVDIVLTAVTATHAPDRD